MPNFPRCPIYLGLDEAINPMTIVEYGDAKLSEPGGGIRVISKGQHSAAFRKLGQATVGATTYNVWSILYLSGDPRKIWRYFKNAPNVVGPYTLHTAPTVLKDFLRSLNAEGDLKAPWVIAGDDPSYLSGLDYVEGANANGDDDEITEA